MRRRALMGGAAAAGLALAACNLLTGAADLEVVGASDAATSSDRGLRDAADDGSFPGDAVRPDAASDAATCTSSAATSLLGVARNVSPTVVELTTDAPTLAGGIASPTAVSLDSFDVSFSYSMTYASGSPAAGIAFYAIAAGLTELKCLSGPNLCTLGASAPGFAVIIRTSKAVASDPAVPYIAVVDARSYPASVPVAPTPLDATKAAALLFGLDAGVPPQSTFHTMTIAARSGRVTVGIDGADVLVNVPIPGHAPGRVGTWGIGASTALGNSFAQRSVVSAISFQCR